MTALYWPCLLAAGLFLASAIIRKRDDDPDRWFDDLDRDDNDADESD